MMIKKCILYLSLCICFACGSNKSVIRTTKDSKPVVKTVKKPIQRPTENSKKPHNQEEQVKQTTEVLEAATRVKVTTALVLEYINVYKTIAQDDMIQYGIPASITLGQGILESGAGTGPLSAQANNHFGIKCHKEWSGPSIKYDDDEVQECFRKYNNPNDSFRDHSLFLTSRPRYGALFKLERDDYKGWARGLKSAGYATDKEYANKLISLIERYQLHQYDAEVLGKEFVPKTNDKIQNSDTRVAINKEQHQVTKGDTLYSISKRYNISIEDLKRKNNISDNAISIGQTLQVK